MTPPLPKPISPVSPPARPASLRAVALIAGLLLAFALPAPATEPGSPGTPALSLIPMPSSVRPAPGTLPLTDASRIVAADAALAPLAKILSDEILAVAGVRLAPASGDPQPGDVVLRIDPAMTGEAYALDVAETAEVRAGNYFAVASGSVTLLQAVRPGNAPNLPRVRIEDRPAHSYRGLLIDLARKYHSPAGVRQVIELCRLYKIRHLHVHISDDQLFMFPSTRFPEVGKGNREFARFEPGSRPQVPPYTLGELRDLERFSQERGVHIVPEIDLPGHSGRLVGDAPEIFAFEGNGSTVNIASPRTLEALATLLNEVMDVFQGTPYVHLGADEVGLGGLENTPEYRQAKEKLGNISSPHDLYCKFVADMHRVIARRGKKMIVWEEGWNPAGPYPLPKDTLVMVWSQGRNPAEIVKSGYAIVNATWTPLYIVRDNKRSLEFLFDWDLLKFGREGSDAYTLLPATDRLLGAQLCSWENSESIEIQSLRDRLALVAERTWNPKSGGTLDGFRRRLAHTDAILERLVCPISIRVAGRLIRDENTFEEPITITLASDRKDLAIRYTLDNSLPNPKWKPYTGPIRLDQTAHLRAGLFDADGRQQGYLVGGWYRRIIAVKPNLATGKPVQVGPGPDRDDAWSARVAVDGRADEVTAHWASTDPAPQWLQVDLQQVRPVDSINVMTYYDGSRYYQLNVEVSIDGTTWTKVLDFSKDTAPATAAGYGGSFPKVDARYVRVNMLRNSANPWVHIVELIVNRAEEPPKN